MKDLTLEQLLEVNGGMKDAKACANAMIAAGSAGAFIGAIGGFIGSGIGAMVGGALEAKYGDACK